MNESRFDQGNLTREPFIMDPMVKATRTYEKGSRLLIELVEAIDAKWTNRKSTPPKELVTVLAKVKEFLDD